MRADAARAAWRAAAIAVQRVRHLRFGPLDAFDRSFRLALFPDPRNVVGRELAALLHAADPTLADEAEPNWAAVAQAAAAITPDLETAVADPRGRAAIEDLLRAIVDLRRLLSERVGPVIGLPVGFNPMDGD